MRCGCYFDGTEGDILDQDGKPFEDEFALLCNECYCMKRLFPRYFLQYFGQMKYWYLANLKLLSTHDWEHFCKLDKENKAVQDELIWYD